MDSNAVDLTTVVHYLSRWIHYIAGVAWIGHLYFFNFVNANLQPTLDGDTKKKVNPQLMPRALFLFRWGAMFTFITGLIMLWILYFAPAMAADGGWAGQFGTVKGWYMIMGATFGTIMWFNVWFIIWPLQKKIIKGVRGEAPAAAPETVKLAGNASKLNTYLSVPMLLGMMGGAHPNPVFGDGMAGAAMMACGVAVGLGLVWLGYKFAPKIDVTKL